MSNDDRSSLETNLDDLLIDLEDPIIEKARQTKPKIRVRMENQVWENVFDDVDDVDDVSPHVVRISNNFISNLDSLPDGVKLKQPISNKIESNGDETENNRESPDNDNGIENSGEYYNDRQSRSLDNSPDDSQDDSQDDSSDISQDSSELIDVTPGASVARIKNQTISARDDDIDVMRRHRNIVGQLNAADTTDHSDSQNNNISQSDRQRNSPNRKTKRKVKHPNGYLQLTFGSMYSGKSSELRSNRNDWNSISDICILVINYARDTRYSDGSMVMTHNKEGVKCISVEHLAEITNGECYDEAGNVVLPEDYDIILVDEGQFYDDLKDNIIHWVDILSKTVYVYGLDGDFRRQKFGQMMDLVPLCDKIVKKKAKCMLCNDGTDALFTWKLENNSDADTNLEIGAADKYIALCRKHYNRLNKPQVVITGNIYSKK